MIWFSGFQVNPYEHGIKDCYDWHQFVWQLFPDQSRNDRPFLFRLDKAEDTTRATLLSTVAPTPPKALPDRPVHRWRSDQLPEDFFSHTHYRFDLRANATRRDASRDAYQGRERRHRRFVLTSIEEQRAWLVRNGESAGFTIFENDLTWLEIDPREDFRFSRGGKKGLLIGTRFRGALAVTDPILFRNAILQGIGRGRSFGFGLIMIQPVVV
jgi:CRISPR system Cascade subunit CasE